jgi:hypothetical protein
MITAYFTRRLYLWRARRTYGAAAYAYICTQPTHRYIVRH